MKTVTYDETLWKLVPVEPTDAMVRQSLHLDLSYMPGHEGPDRAAVYRAMLSAAPAQPAQQLPPVVASAPGHIWLDLGFDPNEEAVHFSNLTDVTWSEDNATGDGIKYVRSDLAGGNHPAQQERQPMTDEERGRVFGAAKAAMTIDPNLAWRHAIVNAVERHHRIRKE